MQDLARPKLFGNGREGAACKSASRRKSLRPRPKKPSAPASSISRLVQPPQTRLGDPRIRSMIELPCGWNGAHRQELGSSSKTAPAESDRTSHRSMVARLIGNGQRESAPSGRIGASVDENNSCPLSIYNK